MSTRRIPALGPRGEGWVVAQLVAGGAVLVLGFLGPRWPSSVDTTFTVIGAVVGVCGVLLLIAGIAALGPSLTPFPRPSDGSTLREGGAYRLVRHPIYGGLLLLALGWSLVRSPPALVASAVFAAVLDLKSRYEERLLAERYPDYEAYRRRVRRRFVPGIL